MEDIKVGEYVRTRQGRITRLIKIAFHNVVIGHGLQEYQPYCKFENSYCICADNKKELYEKINTYVVKHSFNLIDLIEVGDIVFIQDVLNNDFVYIYDDEMLKAVKEDVESGLEITEILTHEQYEAKCYKINKTPTK